MTGTLASRSLLRFVSHLLIALGVFLMGVAGIYSGYLLYTQYQLAAFPKSERLLLTEASVPPSGLPVQEEPPIFLPTAPMGEVVSRTRPPALRVAIPTIGVDSGIVELGTTYDERGELVWETPKHAVGHHLGTANPGESGNVVLSGHISSPIRREGNIFSRLPQLKLGESVLLETEDGLYTYRLVSRDIVEPTEVSVMDPTPTPILTLITCYPDWVYSHRLVLTAEPIAFQANSN